MQGGRIPINPATLSYFSNSSTAGWGTSGQMSMEQDSVGSKKAGMRLPRPLTVAGVTQPSERARERFAAKHEAVLARCSAEKEHWPRACATDSRPWPHSLQEGPRPELFVRLPSHLERTSSVGSQDAQTIMAYFIKSGLCDFCAAAQKLLTPERLYTVRRCWCETVPSGF
jgi:hypothetical protein